jgi:TolA-binding protein
MNITEVRNVVRQAIAEAMEKGGLPKSGGKLVHLKKEMEGLKKMREALGQYQIAEGGDSSAPTFVAEYAHMQKFVNELEKIKSAHAKLAEMLDGQITEVDGKIKSETEKIKEMMGLIEKAKKEPKEKKEKKTAHEKGESKAEEKAEHSKEKKDDKKKSKKLDENEVPTITKAEKSPSNPRQVALTLSNGKKVSVSTGDLEGIYGGDSNNLKQYVGQKWEQGEHELDEARFKKVVAKGK